MLMNTVLTTAIFAAYSFVANIESDTNVIQTYENRCPLLLSNAEQNRKALFKASRLQKRVLIFAVDIKTTNKYIVSKKYRCYIIIIVIDILTTLDYYVGMVTKNKNNHHKPIHSYT